ncbi:MAG: hypothetical protein WA728_30910 [Xanthobacteraceae bacterium]
MNEGLEHSSQLKCRTTNDLEHIGGGGLLLQRFAQFIQQPRVLDGDGRLVGEGFYKLDLLVGEWLDFHPAD